MTDLSFLVSNPPHGSIDAVRAAAIFGTTVAEARIKVNAPAPEVWFVDESGDGLLETMDALRALGANVSPVSGGAIAGLGDRLALRAFEFSADALQLEVGAEERVTIPFHWAGHAVPCRPEATGSVVRMTVRQAARAANRSKSPRQQARTSLSAIKKPVDDSFVDLYFTDGECVRRFTMWPGRTSFSGLRARKKPGSRQNIATFMADLRERFDRFHTDRRLEDAPPPRITFLGSRTLRGHLRLVDPVLRDVSDHDLMSRLAFLASRTDPPPGKAVHPAN